MFWTFEFRSFDIFSDFDIRTSGLIFTSSQFEFSYAGRIVLSIPHFSYVFP